MLSKRAKQSKSYIFSQLKREKLEIEKEYKIKVADFSAGIPKYPPSSLYKKYLSKLVKEDRIYLYPSYKPEKELELAIKNWYFKRFKVDKDLKIQIGHGAKDILTHLIPVVADEGETILLPDPGYPGFSSTFDIFKVRKSFYLLSEKEDFKLNLAEIEKKITRYTKAIILNFPSNPTGQTITLKDLQKVVDLCWERKILIIYDNAYSEIYFEEKNRPVSIFQCKRSEEIAVEIGSFSKSFSFAGLRLGWIIGKAEVIEAYEKLKSLFDTGVPKAFQYTGAYALDNFDINWHKAMIEHYKQNMKKLQQ